MQKAVASLHDNNGTVTDTLEFSHDNFVGLLEAVNRKWRRAINDGSRVVIGFTNVVDCHAN